MPLLSQSALLSVCRGTRRLSYILFRFSFIFTPFIEPSKGFSRLCSVKALFSASHYVCASFFFLPPIRRPSTPIVHWLL
jgi:hypothetical protein